MARSIFLVSIVLGLVVFALGVFAAQPPAPAPPPKAAPAPPPKAAPPPPPKAAPPPAAPAAKKPYIVDKVDEEQKKKRTQVTLKFLRAQSFGQGQQDVLDTYYKTYALARWSDPKNAASLEAFRKELRIDLRTAKSGPIHDHLNSLILDYMKIRATGHYDPAARFNATLIIGELNSVERKDPVPLPAALLVLVSALEDPQQLDVVEVAALVGILRHLKLGAVKAPNDVQAVGGAALAVLGSQRPPDRSADGHHWMRKLAAEVLGELGAVGSGGAVATAMKDIVADAGAPFYARCSAADALGKLNYAGAAGLDASKLAAPLGRLAADACAAEAKALAEAKEKKEAEAEAQMPGAAPPIFGPGGAPGAGGLFGPPGVKPPTEIPIAFRRRLRYRVFAASFGLGGTTENPAGIASLAAGTPHAQFVATLQKHIQAILNIIEKNREDDDVQLKAMMDKIKPAADQLRAVLSNPTPPTPPTP